MQKKRERRGLSLRVDVRIVYLCLRLCSEQLLRPYAVCGGFLSMRAFEDGQMKNGGTLSRCFRFPLQRICVFCCLRSLRHVYADKPGIVVVFVQVIVAIRLFLLFGARFSFSPSSHRIYTRIYVTKSNESDSKIENNWMSNKIDEKQIPYKIIHGDFTQWPEWFRAGACAYVRLCVFCVDNK